MNIFRRSWNRISRRGKPKDLQTTGQDVRRMDDKSFLEWIGIKRERRTPTSEVTYFTCLKMMSETIAKMPIKYFQKNGTRDHRAAGNRHFKAFAKSPESVHDTNCILEHG